ncbi:MAG TPA: T9SS type A sorting domain-containing protein, partial [Tenuifilaceae bacterium]|nr:T9SS type A sorting domain-containing protein [Tenuifilaceae bacterium]
VYEWAPVTTLDKSVSITLTNQLVDKNNFYRIDTETPGEFFLIENRNQLSFDKKIPGSGMIIYHVHADVFNSGNRINAGVPQKMYPICANAGQNPSSTPTSYGPINSGGTPFPGTSNITSFTSSTYPSMIAWNGTAVDKPITNIKRGDVATDITFEFMGGYSDNPLSFNATALSTTEIQLNWLKFENKNVILAYSNAPIIANLQDGNSYTLGQTLSDGSQILYAGDLETFSHSNLSASTKYYYKIWTILNETPAYSSGVLAESSTICELISTLPYSNNFENEFLPACWEQEYVANSLSWIWGKGNGESNPASAHTGNNNIYFRAISPSEMNSVSKLLLPAFNLEGFTSNNVVLEFWLTNAKRNSYQDVLKVYYRTNESSWTLLKTYNTDMTSWTKQTLNIPEKGNSVQIAFEARANWGYGVCIDDINLYEGSPVSTPTNELENARIYPNPFSNEINIENLVAAKKVKVVNLLGQTLIDQQVSNETSTKINTENLASGIYLIVIEGKNGLRAVNKLVKR